MDKKEFTSDFLQLCGANTIDELSDEQLVLYYDIVNDFFGGEARTIYNECNKEERKQFITDLKESISNGKVIHTYHTYPEGVLNDESLPYFEFCSRHSVWYYIT